MLAHILIKYDVKAKTEAGGRELWDAQDAEPQREDLD